MTNIDITITGIDDIRRKLTDDRLAQKLGTAWGMIYLSFMKFRFIKFSQGGGDWPPLAQSTKDGRRGNGDKAAILRNTNLMFASLSAVGFIVLASVNGDLAVINIKLDLSRRYPNGQATVADVALFHDKGGGRLPQRKIFENPDPLTTNKLARAAKDILRDEINDRPGA